MSNNGSLEDLQNNLAKDATGITKQEAHDKDICIRCKKPVNVFAMSAINRREYRISGLCGKCWDEIWGGEEG